MGKRTSGGLAALSIAAVLAATGCGVTSDSGADAEGSASADGPLTDLRIMVPNSAGGGYDTTARVAAQTMESEGIAESIEVFNLPGAGGTVGLARLINEEGNGDLAMLMGLGVVGASHTNDTDARLTDTEPIARLVEEPGAIVVPKDSPYETIDDFVEAWKADPALLAVGGGSSPGGPDHLLPMQLAETVGIDPTTVNYVSYDGGGDLLPALLGSKIAAAASGIGEFKQQVENGDIRVLAVSSEERLEGIDAPTLVESDIDLVFSNWRGIVAPPGTSEEDQQELTDALTEMHGTDAWKDALETNQWTDAFLTGEEFEAFLGEQDDRVSNTLEQLGLG
ncbi:tripartite tricarboxylate transporter substrate-binding protein [Zhihengliuella sp.]|uniref:Bug family tripartite tricarboxylate transporter substrate binding protein n=1 Tax=Zhihengliuella sp. TaxID=1954483 RepID=UPI00281246F5|nr:tripartite tricarboxylate transporter substrate-binding protein [Zhihengliuella sp.]